MRNNKPLGFSLLETVLTMFLVCGVLTICCDLFKQYSTALNVSATKANSLTVLQSALQRMVDDARQATAIVAPNTIGAAGIDHLTLQMVDPTLLNSPSRGVRDQITVRYYLSDGTLFPAGALLRDSTPANPPNSPTTTWKMAESVAGISVVGLDSRPVTGAGGPNAIEITLSIQEASRVLVLTGNSLRPWF